MRRRTNLSLVGVRFEESPRGIWPFGVFFCHCDERFGPGRSAVGQASRVAEARFGVRIIRLAIAILVRGVRFNNLRGGLSLGTTLSSGRNGWGHRTDSELSPARAWSRSRPRNDRSLRRFHARVTAIRVTGAPRCRYGPVPAARDGSGCRHTARSSAARAIRPPTRALPKRGSSTTNRTGASPARFSPCFTLRSLGEPVIDLGEHRA